MLSHTYWLAVAERAIKTFAQVLSGILLVDGGGTIVGVDVLSVDWRGALSLAAGATLISVLMSLGSTPFGSQSTPSPSLVDETGDKPEQLDHTTTSSSQSSSRSTSQSSSTTHQAKE